MTGCFAVGTKLWTPDGFRNVEEILEGQYVFSRNEFDPDGPIVAKRVEAKYERTGCIFNLHLDSGRIIRTTPEHPFFEYHKGWTAAGVLVAGDRIRTDAAWVNVAEVFDTGEYEKVYNLRVAEWHTYFVGGEGWGEAVWAHNRYDLLHEFAKGKVFTFTEPGGYVTQWYVPNAFLTKKGTPIKAVEDAVKQDAQLGLGNALQTEVTRYATTDWNNLPVLQKAIGGRRTAIEDALVVANEIYQQLGMSVLSFDAYLNGASLPLIPSIRPGNVQMTDEAYAAIKNQHGDALHLANQQRAAAKGDFVHAKIEEYAGSHGFQYFDPGIDLLYTNTALRFEVMRTAAWTDHSGPAFQASYWRSLQY